MKRKHTIALIVPRHSHIRPPSKTIFALIPARIPTHAVYLRAGSHFRKRVSLRTHERRHNGQRPVPERSSPKPKAPLKMYQCVLAGWMSDFIPFYHIRWSGRKWCSRPKLHTAWQSQSAHEQVPQGHAQAAHPAICKFSTRGRGY